MTDQELRDTKYVWHCNCRKTSACNDFYRCRGSECRNYKPNPGSFYDLNPIRKGQKNGSR
jgi:hypothetical protein